MTIPQADKPPICCAPPTSDAGAGAPGAEIAVAVPRPSTWHHWIFLVIACGAVIASLALSVRGQEQVVIPVLNKALPGTCTFRRLTNLPCPGCGMTRSFISVAHGHLAAAWTFNPAGIAFFVVVVFQIPYRIFQIARLHRGMPEHRFVALDHWVLVGLVVILVIHWVYALTLHLW